MVNESVYAVQSMAPLALTFFPRAGLDPFYQASWHGARVGSPRRFRRSTISIFACQLRVDQSDQTVRSPSNDVQRESSPRSPSEFDMDGCAGSHFTES